MTLAVIATHPIQYHSPVYRLLQSHHNIPVTVIYGSDFSVVGYLDKGFGAAFAWDTDLLSGFSSIFLNKVAVGGAKSPEQVSAKGLRTVLRDLKPRAVLLTGYAFRFQHHAILQVVLSSCPVLYRAEATDHARSRDIAKNVVRDLLLRTLYRRCKAVLYIGEHARTHYRRLGVPNSKLFFSPYCVDTSPFLLEENQRFTLRQKTRADLRVSDNTILIAFVGKLIPVKAPELLVQAAQGVPEELRNRIELLFVGDGELHSQLMDMAAQEPVVRSHFVGFQNQHSLSSFYHAADLMVLPSRENETWGLVVNEALHHGVPCIVSRGVGSAPDLIRPGVTGGLFEIGNSESLSRALADAVALVGRLDIREQCRQQVAQYNVEKAATGVAQAYHKVVGAHKRSG